MRRILAGAWAIGMFGIAGVALAQTTLPERAAETQMNAAFEDLSAVYGAPVVRIDQAKAICNEEKYIVDCAEIGKKHDLFSDARAKQVDTLLAEFKGEVVEKMKRCEDIACLVEVAASIAERLNSGNPSVARAMELTPQKVKEKKTIVDTAKSLGVDIEECRTMDPDTASIELLRGCARLAKHENVQKYIPQETKNRAEGADAAIALRESLASGKISCGDNTLEGCGNFCLNPSPEARANGVSAMPPICRQIATQFFGGNGIKELEKAYTTVQETFDTLAVRAQNITFTTADGRTLSDPSSIGRYMEDAGSKGDVEAVSRGMDFLIAKGFVTPEERDFALSMVKKVKERGSVNFGECRTDPSKCADLISEEDRGQFTAMGEIDKIMKDEMGKRGISDPSKCSSDPSAGQSCMEAARAALPQIELLAKDSPQVQAIVSDIRQKIRFGEAGMEARSRVEERLKTTGDFSIAGNSFNSVSDVESFCRSNPQQCLTETVREGFIPKDIAAEKYERAMEIRYSAVPQINMPRAQIMAGEFNKEEALQQFKQWLDNPQGPPPMPPVIGPAQYQQQYQTQYPQYPSPYSPYQRPPIDQSRCQYAAAMPVPCKAGEYRQESVNEFGCSVFGSCIPFDTKTEPPRIDARNICPALPTVESCPAGEEKAIAFSSPECGTYYSCRSVYKPPIDDQNRATAVCDKYGRGWRSIDSSGNCFGPSMSEYRTVSGALNSCASSPVYGCSPAVSCSSEQYFDGSACVSSTQNTYQQSCGYNEYWNGSSCVTSTTQTNTNTTATGSCSSELIGLLGSGCHSMGSGWFNGEMTSYVLSNSQTVRSCTAEYVSSCSGGTYTQTQTSCPSGQYWSGSSCVSSTQSTTGTYDTASAQQGCSNAGGTWDSSANYCRMPSSSSTSCPSGQYWNGSACQSSESTYTAPAYTPPPDSTYTAPSSDSYTPPPTTESYTPPPTTTGSEPISYVFCPDGHDWNGAYCTLSPRSPFERYTANAWSAVRSLLGL